MGFLLRPEVILFALSPIYAEVISGATPLSAYLNPLSIIFQLAFYGSAAVVIRELAQSSKNKWAAVFILGLALAILEEGIMTKVFFNPASGVSPLVNYGRIGDLNLPLALQLLLYHSVVSIALPIFLIELIFPTKSRQTWLSRTKTIILGAVLALTTLVGTTVFFPYQTAPTNILLCLATISVLIILSRVIGSWKQTNIPKNGNWTIFLRGFGFMTSVLGSAFVLPALKIDGAVITAFLILLGLLGTRVISKTDFSNLSLFYLASGVTASLLVFDVVLVLIGRTEMLAIIMAVLLGLWLLKQRLTKTKPV